MPRKNAIERYSPLTALLLTTGIMGLSYFLLAPVWGDATTQHLHWSLISNTTSDSSLHPYLVHLLAKAYNYSNAPYLAIFLYGLYGLSIWIIGALFLYKSGSKWRLALLGLGIVGLFWSIWQELTLYGTALVLSATSMLLLWQSFRLHKNWQSWLSWLPASLWMSMAVAIDFQASLAGLILLPLVLHSWGLNPKKSLRHLLQIALLVLGGLLILWTGLQQKKQTAAPPSPTAEVLDALQKYDWEGYRWTEERALFYHQHLGWRAADYKLIQAGYSADADFLAVEAMRMLKEELGNQPHYSQEGLLRKLNRFALHHLRYAGGWLGLPFLLLLLFITDFSALNRLAWAVLAAIFSWMSYLLYWILLWEATKTFYFSSFSVIGLALLLLAGFKGQLSRANKWTILFFLSAIILGQVFWNLDQLKAAYQLPQQHKVISSILTDNSHVLVLEEKDFVLGQPVWEVPSPSFNLHYLKDWNNYPAQKLNKNIDQAPHYVFAQKESAWIEDYQAHLLEHYRLPIRLDSLNFDSQTAVYLYELKRDSL